MGSRISVALTALMFCLALASPAVASYPGGAVATDLPILKVDSSGGAIAPTAIPLAAPARRPLQSSKIPLPLKVVPPGAKPSKSVPTNRSGGFRAPAADSNAATPQVATMQAITDSYSDPSERKLPQTGSGITATLLAGLLLLGLGDALRGHRLVRQQRV